MSLIKEECTKGLEGLLLLKFHVLLIVVVLLNSLRLLTQPWTVIVGVYIEK